MAFTPRDIEQCTALGNEASNKLAEMKNRAVAGMHMLRAVVSNLDGKVISVKEENPKEVMGSEDGGSDSDGSGKETNDKPKVDTQTDPFVPAAPTMSSNPFVYIPVPVTQPDEKMANLLIVIVGSRRPKKWLDMKG